MASGISTPAGVDTGVSAFGNEEFSYSFNPNTALAGGTYWLVLHNGASNTLPATNFNWEWSNETAGNSVNADLSSLAGGCSPTTTLCVVSGSGPSLNPPFIPVWVSNEAELAFQLTISTPEPVSMSLVGGGLLLACFARKLKGNKA